MSCGIGPQPSLRDSRPFGVEPSAEALGYSRLSLRDTKTVAFQCRQNGPDVQQHHLWAMSNSSWAGNTARASQHGLQTGARLTQASRQHLTFCLPRSNPWTPRDGVSVTRSLCEDGFVRCGAGVLDTPEPAFLC